MSIYDQEVLKVLLSPTYPPRIKIKVIQIIRKPKEAFDNHKLSGRSTPLLTPTKIKMQIKALEDSNNFKLHCCGILYIDMGCQISVKDEIMQMTPFPVYFWCFLGKVRAKCFSRHNLEYETSAKKILI